MTKRVKKKGALKEKEEMKKLRTERRRKKNKTKKKKKKQSQTKTQLWNLKRKQWQQTLLPSAGCQVIWAHPHFEIPLGVVIGSTLH